MGTTRNLRTGGLRYVVLSLAAVLVIGLAAGCGDDDTSPEAAFCEAGDNLRADIESIRDIDLLGDGLDAIEERFEAIKNDLAQLQSSGSDVADDEITALDEAVDAFRTALDAVGADLSVANARDVAVAGATVVPAANAVLEKLTSTCS